MKKSYLRICLVSLLLAIKIVIPTWAQSEEGITLNLRRNFGYSSGTGKIQGTFTMIVAGPEDLNKVDFLIDDEVIGKVDEAPFHLQFHTGDYPLGVHTITAIGYARDGSELYANEIRVEFVSAEEGWNSARKILIPILGIVFGGMLLSYLISMAVSRRTKGRPSSGVPRDYGIFGGAVCPKCGRPFGRHIWGLNLGAGKFDRCPNCGKWSLVRRASLQELIAAESTESKVEAESDHPLTLSEDERLRKELEDSRYQDL